MSVTYRYRCVTENAWVQETRDETATAPTVCVNEGGAIEANSLSVVAEPLLAGDVEICAGQELDVTGATIEGMSHTSLLDIGTNTHAQIDAHLSDSTKHCVINDSGTATDELWSASKISAQLATKSADGHTHTSSDISDFSAAVSGHSSVAANDAHRVRTDNPHAVTKAQVGLGDVPNIKCNFVATEAPTANDDVGDGYVVGSRWIDTVDDTEYVCADASAAAAVWVETTGGGGGGGGEVDAQNATATVLASTTSTNAIDLHAMSLTTSNTAAKRYMVTFTAMCWNEKKETGFFDLYVDGASAFTASIYYKQTLGNESDDEGSDSSEGNGNADAYMPLNLSYVTDPLVTGKVIKIRFRTSHGGTLRVRARTLSIYG